MRTLIFLFWLFPAMLSAQINRSATELAKENIHEYLTAKIFKSCPYQPISYGELTPLDNQNTDVKWAIVHKFEITETKIETDKKVAIQKLYEFIFYLDNKMKVLNARSYTE